MRRSPRVSVVMPTYDQDAFLPGAVASLQAQSLQDWELIVVEDGSPGDAAAALGPALDDPRIRLERLEVNVGLGAALNRGLDLAHGPLVAYLPSDDVLFRGHLASLVAALDAHPEALLAVAGVRHGDGEQAEGRIPGEPLQLVQAMHRRTPERWTERAELTTDDLDRMLWSRLIEHGGEVRTGRVSCTWTDHPRQRHKVMREPRGGLNPYRARYGVREPLRFRSTVGHAHDEPREYRVLRERPDTPRAPDGLRILLVGELAHNPSRILALEERGHELHGLWTDDPHWYNTVGPLPFGHVRDVPRDDWRRRVRDLRPDVIYGLLNFPAVPVAHEVLTADLGIPFVWHFKEGPTDARRRGCWPELVDLLTRSDGQIYSTPEMREWFAATVPSTRGGLAHVLDGDLPRALPAGSRSRLISESEGGIHTVIPGRPMGPHPEVARVLARHGIHIHLYSEKAQVQWRSWVEAVERAAPGHLHLHPQVDESEWLGEFSRYDAGWLHDVRSANAGDLHGATWDDLNYPARMSTLALTGVPSIQRDNGRHTVATQRLAERHGLGVLYRDAEHLASQLLDRARMASLRESVWRHRGEFTFDAHADALVAFFRRVIADRAGTTAPDDAAPAPDLTGRAAAGG